MSSEFYSASPGAATSFLSLRIGTGEAIDSTACDAVLGSIWHADLSTTAMADIHVAMPRLLSPQASVMEQWCGTGEVREGRRGLARYRCNEDFLFVAVTLDEHEADIGAAAQQAYAALFDVMAAEGFEHLVRCWNYFAHINAEWADRDGLLERYRLFNIGRQAAFEAARHSADVGAPAACALGTDAGPLTLYALASRIAPRCVENPRQLSAYRYPERYGPKSPSFSRGSVLHDSRGGDVLFVSGTASIVGHESMHLGDVVAQTEESLRNIVTVVAQANLGLGREVFSSHKLCYKVFVRHASDALAVADTVRRVMGAATNLVVLRADVCRAELLVEIEAVGFA